MRSIIVDDEEPAPDRLGRLFAVHPDIVGVGEARDGLEAGEKVEELQPELLFLDIQMPGLTGFEVLQSIPPAVAMPLVIFVTGYDRHALAAFEANAVAYLLKPVEPERLAQAVERARKLSGTASEVERERAHVLRVAREAPKVLRQIVCRKRDPLLLTPPEQICWFQVQDGLATPPTPTHTFTANYQLSALQPH